MANDTKLNDGDVTAIRNLLKSKWGTGTIEFTYLPAYGRTVFFYHPSRMVSMYQVIVEDNSLHIIRIMD